MTGEEIIKKKVPFTAEQMDIVRSMIEEVKENSKSQSPNNISMYNLRDITAIETVNVKRYDGKFVLGFKNHQKDTGEFQADISSWRLCNHGQYFCDEKSLWKRGSTSKRLF